jgi:hypothetical protein
MKRIQLSNAWLKSAMFAIAIATAATAGAQSSDPDAPTPLMSNSIEGIANGKKATLTFYSFAAGPGDLRLTVDSTSNEYSVLYTIEILSADDFESIEKISAMAAGDSRRLKKTITLAEREPLILKIATPKDDTVKWIKYKIRLEGNVELSAGAVPYPANASAPPSMPPMPDPGMAPPPTDAALPPLPPDATMPPMPPMPPDAPMAPEPPPAPPQANAMLTGVNQVLGAIPGDGSQSTSKFLTKLVNGLNALQSAGTLTIEMKDGTVQQIDLTKVKKMKVLK